MIVIRTKFFDNQVFSLEKKYTKVELDLEYFTLNLQLEPFSDLWSWFYKYRIKNSSVPTWKRWWFRLIIKKYNDKILPLFIYSKNMKDNISEKEIIYWLEQVLGEL